MPLSSVASLAQLIKEGLAAIRIRLPGKNSDLTSYLGKQTYAWTMGLFGLQRTAEAIDRESPPNLKSSDLGIKTWAEISGVPSNNGNYGINGAVIATGGQAPVTGTGGVVVLDGQQLVGPDGVTIFKLVGNVTIPATGTFVAVTAGKVGNLEAGTKLTWITPPTGCGASVVLAIALSGGDDEESIPHLFVRLRDRWQSPPKGGANIDYKEWAESVAGVAAAFVYSRRGGTLTVHVAITAAGSGLTRLASDALILAVQTKLDSLKPTHVDEVIVMTGTMPSTRPLTIVASAFLAVGYQWDWVDTGGSWTVAGYSSAGPVTLTLNTTPDITLRNAVSNGDQPLIQVVSSTSGAPVVIEQVRVTSFSGSVLTLANALSVAPTVGDAVLAGSYAAPAAAAAILAFVDALGPSRVSGFADEVTRWDDIASVWGCGNAALVVNDTDGITRMFSRLAGVNGLTIQVGAGSPAAVDFEPADTYLDPPEIARAARVIVRQAAA